MKLHYQDLQALLKLVEKRLSQEKDNKELKELEYKLKHMLWESL